MWGIVRILLLLAWFTPDGRLIISRAIKFFVGLAIVIALLIKFMMWWVYTPTSPGYSQDAVNQAHELDRIAEKRKSCENIAPANWDDECRKLTMSNY